MKTVNIFFVEVILMVFHLSIANIQADELGFVRQISYVNGWPVSTDIPIDQFSGSYSDNGHLFSGSKLSHPMDTDISVFQLFAPYTNESGVTQIVKIDEETTGTFLPSVAVTIDTPDPFSSDPYDPASTKITRSDIPYGITVKVEGLLNGNAVPSYAKSVLVDRGYKLHSPISMAPDGREGKYHESYKLISNGEHIETTVYQKIPDGSPTQALGTETVSAYVLPTPDSGLNKVASAEVVILPVATASIEGIEEGKIYYNVPKNGIVKLVNAYPRGWTFVRIFKGSPGSDAVPAYTEGVYGALYWGGTNPRPKLPGGGMLIPGGMRGFSARVGGVFTPTPRHAVIPIELEQLAGSFLKGGGEFTVDVWTMIGPTLFEPELLAQVSFTIENTIQVRGSISSIE